MYDFITNEFFLYLALGCVCLAFFLYLRSRRRRRKELDYRRSLSQRIREKWRKEKQKAI